MHGSSLSTIDSEHPLWNCTDLSLKPLLLFVLPCIRDTNYYDEDNSIKINDLILLSIHFQKRAIWFLNLFDMKGYSIILAAFDPFLVEFAQ